MATVSTVDVAAEPAPPPASVTAVAPPASVTVVELARPPTAVAPPASVTVDEPARPPTAVDAAALVGLLGNDAAVMIDLLPELDRVATWDAAAQLVFACCSSWSLAFWFRWH